MSGRVLIGLYAVLVIIGFFMIRERAINAGEIKGVSAGRWAVLRPTVSYLTTQNLLPGHLVREQDLKTPQVSHNLASALPDKTDLIGKYVLDSIAMGGPVKAGLLAVVPSDLEAGAGRKLLRLPVDSTLVNRINAGTPVWLVRGDTLVAKATIGQLICQTSKCEARMLIDSALVRRIVKGGRAILPLSVRLPLIEWLP